jgi:hypothetical protein
VDAAREDGRELEGSESKPEVKRGEYGECMVMGG